MQRGLCLIAIVIACLALSAAPAGAVNLTGGCQGQGTSFDKDHNQIMAATAPSAEPGTSGNPFLVDYDGTVEYAGTGPLMLNHHWEIKVFGIPVKSGGAPNGSHQTATIGVADVSDYLPFKITGVYYVSGEIHGDGGACSGDAYREAPRFPGRHDSVDRRHRADRGRCRARVRVAPEGKAERRRSLGARGCLRRVGRPASGAPDRAADASAGAHLERATDGARACAVRRARADRAAATDTANPASTPPPPPSPSSPPLISTPDGSPA